MWLREIDGQVFTVNGNVASTLSQVYTRNSGLSSPDGINHFHYIEENLRSVIIKFPVVLASEQCVGALFQRKRTASCTVRVPTWF